MQTTRKARKHDGATGPDHRPRQPESTTGKRLRRDGPPAPPRPHRPRRRDRRPSAAARTAEPHSRPRPRAGEGHRPARARATSLAPRPNLKGNRHVPLDTLIQPRGPDRSLKREPLETAVFSWL